MKWHFQNVMCIQFLVKELISFLIVSEMMGVGAYLVIGMNSKTPTISKNLKYAIHPLQNKAPKTLIYILLIK